MWLNRMYKWLRTEWIAMVNVGNVYKIMNRLGIMNLAVVKKGNFGFRMPKS